MLGLPLALAGLDRIAYVARMKHTSAAGNPVWTADIAMTDRELSR